MHGIILESVDSLVSGRLRYQGLYIGQDRSLYVDSAKNEHRQIEELHMLVESSPRYTEQTEAWNAFWRTLVGDPVDERLRAGLDFGEDGRKSIEILDTLRARGWEPYQFNSHLLERVLNRVFLMVTDSKLWVPHATHTGDLVGLIDGFPVPMILRPKDRSYLVTGHSYFYGIMDGEARSWPGTKLQAINLI